MRLEEASSTSPPIGGGDKEENILRSKLLKYGSIPIPCAVEPCEKKVIGVWDGCPFPPLRQCAERYGKENRGKV